MTAVIGSLTQLFTRLHDESDEHFEAAVAQRSLYLLYIALGVALSTFIFTTCWIVSGEQISRRVREEYMHAIVRQDMAFFDHFGTGELISKLTSDINSIQEGISEKVGLTISALSTFISATAIALAINWKLALKVLSVLPTMFVCASLISKLVSKHVNRSLTHNAASNNLAAEVFSAPQLAQSFGTTKDLESVYKASQLEVRKAAVNARLWSGVMLGAMFFILYATYALAFWQGSKSLVLGQVNTGNVVTILFALIIGAFALSNVTRYVQVFVAAVSAGADVFQIIEWVPEIDNLCKTGLPVNKIHGEIDIRHISFSYPGRPESLILEDFCLKIPAKRITALVGPSGSGKSTVVALIERFYKPAGGQILLDGVPIDHLNLASFRSHISLVSQEPQLFRATVLDNIAYGLVGTSLEHIPVMQKLRLVITACEIANITEVIDALPKGFDSLVGDEGTMFSGGQKQRIAIARAVVSNPEILILDEATSALDTKSEKVVQDALDKASQGRTTIIIAHRLSTVRNAHNIVVMEKGCLVEQGSHHQLLSRGGLYSSLVQTQQLPTFVVGQAAKMTNIAGRSRLSGRLPRSRRRSRNRPRSLASDWWSFSRSSLYFTNPLWADDYVLDSLELKPLPEVPFVDEDAETGHVQGKGRILYLILWVSSFARLERLWMISGVVASAVSGIAYSLQALIFAKLIVLFAVPSDRDFASKVGLYSGLFIVVGAITFFAYFISTFLLGLCSEKVVERVRLSTFQNILRQEVSWLEHSDNSPTRMLDLLSTQCTALTGIHSGAFGIFLAVAVNLLTASILSVALSWRLALIVICAVPALLGAGYLRWRLLGIFEEKMASRACQSTEYAREAIISIRTVLSLGRERAVLDTYCTSLLTSSRSAFPSTLRCSLLFSLSQSLTYFVNAFSIWYGAYLIHHHNLTVYQFFVCFIAITFGAQDAGDSFNHAPNITKARNAALSLLSLHHRYPAVDPWATTGLPGSVRHGSISFSNVSFAYPSRPHTPILSNLNITIYPGEFIAFVGPSGSGKSTIIALLELFYRPTAGRILIDGVPIHDLNLAEYRNSIALVPQEPTLYRGTIRFNLTLGANRSISDAEIDTACVEANILHFVDSLPLGLDTIVGADQTPLSRGQKQKFAIARALLRKPKILLLDEAASALDAESERVVQEAVKRVLARGVTVVAVAHQLASIRGADRVVVVEGGSVIEMGEHEELMEKQGKYWEMCLLQGLS